MKIIWLLKACRPKQWTKNLLCFSAIVITPNSSNLFPIIFIATISFIFASSTIYLINDLIDINIDKLHPQKKFRPIPSGKVKIWEAIFLAIFLFFNSIFLATFINTKFVFVISAYLLAQIFYCFVGKNLFLIDIYLISIGFVLRALGGVFSLGALPSPWFLITSGAMALFLAIQKRKSELLRFSEKKSAGRKVLKKYTMNYLEKIELLALSSGFISYMLWASGPIFNGSQTNYMLITCPILLLGINRYQFISGKKKGDLVIGESPTEILFNDLPIKMTLIVLLISCWIITNFA